HSMLPGSIWNVVQIALRVGFLKIGGGEDTTLSHGGNSKNCLDRAARTEGVTVHGFRGGHGNLPGALAENMLDGTSVSHSSLQRTCCMRGNGVNFLWRDTGGSESGFHGPCPLKTGRIWVDHVMRIIGVGFAGEDSVNRGTPRQC